jgi:hypothetical protein
MLIGGPQASVFGTRPVDARGVFMDYDGQPQARPDVTTRGIMLLNSRGCVLARYYLNVFPDLNASSLGSAVHGPAQLPTSACPVLMSSRGVPEIQPGAAAGAGLPAS